MMKQSNYLWFKILNFKIFGVFRKMNVFRFYENLDIFWGHHKTRLFLVPFIYVLGFFSQAQCTELEYLGLLKFKYFLGLCLIVLIFFGVNSICCVQAYVSRTPWDLRIRHKYRNLVMRPTMSFCWVYHAPRINHCISLNKHEIYHISMHK